MPTVNPLMVMLARESKGMSQTALAGKIGVTQPTLSKVENGELVASEEMVQQLAVALQYPESLFYEELDFRQLPLEFYRRRVKVPAATLKAIRARTNFERMRVRRLLQAADVPDLRVIRVDPKQGAEAPARAARQLRIHWNVPPGPIANLIRLIEDAGILVVPFEFENDQVDGLTLYDPRDGLPPIIFYNSRRTGDRIRLTLAHELAHIVLHHHLAIPAEDADTEREAFVFAAEFLMPAEDIRSQLTNLNLQKLAALKAHWKVSMQAMVMHALRLGKITDRQRTYLFSQMSRMGYRTKEPVEIAADKPSLLKELLDYYLKDLQIPEARLGGELHLLPFEFRRYHASLSEAA
jgi:Zn-dependent peptidase ImmA (M78 family)/transcriptional regulator with XRE-family HTH domain